MKIGYDMNQENIRLIVVYKIDTLYTKGDKVYLDQESSSFLEYMKSKQA